MGQKVQGKEVIEAYLEGQMYRCPECNGLMYTVYKIAETFCINKKCALHEVVYETPKIKLKRK